MSALLVVDVLQDTRRNLTGKSDPFGHFLPKHALSTNISDTHLRMCGQKKAQRCFIPYEDTITDDGLTFVYKIIYLYVYFADHLEFELLQLSKLLLSDPSSAYSKRQRWLCGRKKHFKTSVFLMYEATEIRQEVLPVLLQLY